MPQTLRTSRARALAGLVALAAAVWLFSSGGSRLPAADLEQGVDAVLLEESLEIEIVSDSLARVHYLNRTKVLTAKGVDENDVASVFYNPSINVREFRAAVVSPQGKRVEVKKPQFFDRAAFASFELYADDKYRAVSFPGLVPGAVLEYEYEQEVRNLFYLQTRFDFQETDPVRSKIFTLRAPVGFPLRFAVQGTPEYTREEKGDTVVHRWQVRDVPPMKSESWMPPEEDVIPHVRLYLRSFQYGSDRVDATDWNGIARWTRNLSREKEVPTSEVAAKARELTVGLTEPMDKAQRVYEFVQKNINYVAIELGVGGLQPHDSGSVLKYRYGDCKDKATLVIAMLQGVGVHAYPVLIRTRDTGLTDRDYPSSDFNHAIAALPTDDGYLFMDPTSENAPFGDLPWVDQGANALVVKEDGSGDLVQTPLTPPERNRIEWKVTAAVGAGGDLEGTYTIEAWGQEKIEFTAFIAETKPTEREDALARFMARICPGAVLLAHDVIPPKDPQGALKLTIRFKVSRFVVRAGSVDVLSPHLVRFPLVARLADSSTRRHPIFLSNLTRELSEVRLSLPAGKHVRKLPVGGSLEGPGIAATTSYETQSEDGHDVLVVKRSLTLPRREIAAADYPSLKQTLSALLEEESRAVTLQTGG